MDWLNQLGQLGLGFYQADRTASAAAQQAAAQQAAANAQANTSKTWITIAALGGGALLLIGLLIAFTRGK